VTLDVTAGTIVVGGRTLSLRRPPAFVQDILAEGTIVDYYRKHRRFPGEGA